MIQKLKSQDEVCYIQKTVRLENENLPTKSDTVKLMFQYKTHNRKLSFNSALHTLCKQGFPLQGSQLFFWDTVRQIFVYIGCFPSDVSIDVPFQFFQQNLIYLRYRKIARKAETYPQRQTVSKRVKERSIIDAYEKVTLWMKIYDQTDKNGKRKYTLEAAAREVGVAKKTLDDYKNQIRLGEKYNFDFGKNRFEKIGILRNYIKQKKLDNKSKTPPKRPSSPEAEPVIKMEAQAFNSLNNSYDQQNDGYLFHEADSYYDSD